MLGEAKAYTSEYQFSSAFKKAIDSILDTYKKFRGELGLYLHEDFLDKDMDAVAEGILENTLPNVEVELVSLILYSETKAISGTNEYIITSNLMIGESKAAHTIYVWTQEKAISGLSDHPSKGMPNKTKNRE